MSVFALGTRLVVSSLCFLAMNVAVAASTPGDTHVGPLAFQRLRSLHLMSRYQRVRTSRPFGTSS